jgi:dihydrofolate reductase
MRVASRSTLTAPTWAHTKVIRGDLATTIPEVARAVGGELLVAGSAQLVRGLLAHDLLDELELLVYPMAIGRGQRLLDGASAKLRLLETRPIGDVVYARYGRPGL